jgi:restriction system protein
MKLRMAENSLFAILLRKPWWVSALTAVVLLAFTRFALPPHWFVYAAPIALPFIVIAAIVGWRQAKAPGAARVAATDEAVRAMAWDEFAALLEQAWRRDGGTVTRLREPGADFELSLAGRRAVVAARRWKSARTGIEPLRELHAARERREVNDAVYVAIGELSEQAERFALAHRIRIVRPIDLAVILKGSLRTGRPALGRSTG